MQYLHTKGLSLCNADKYGDTPLHEASRYGRVNVVSYLLSYVSMTKNVQGQMPLDVACAKEIREILSTQH